MWCRLWHFILYYILPAILALAAIVLSVYYIATLNKAEYTALIIALLGIFFTVWLKIVTEVSDRRKYRLALLSQIKLELSQNKNTLASILNIEREHQGSSNPAPLRINIWSAATSSLYFPWLDTKLVDDLLSIYGRLDAANYYAEIFKTATYSSQGTTYQADELSNNSRSMYISIATVVSTQINQALLKISKAIEKLK